MEVSFIQHKCQTHSSATALSVKPNFIC